MTSLGTLAREVDASLLDWGRLRPAPDARVSFEELCCQLAAREAMPEGSAFTRLDPPDGGVECFWRLPDGSEVGWQAKFFMNGVNVSQKRQIDRSIERARRTHPRMARYVVCLPANRRQPAGGSRPEFRDRWAGWAKAWKEETGIDVEFWGSAEIEERLGRAEHAGRRKYFFDGAYLDAGWFDANLSAAIERAKPRYVPETNVGLPVSFAFDCLCRTPKFREALQGAAQRIVHHLRASARGAQEHAAADFDLLGKEIDSIAAAASAQVSPACRIDYRTIGRSAGRAQELAEKIAGTLATKRRETVAGGENGPYYPQPFDSEAYHLDELRFLLAGLEDSTKSSEYASANTKALVVRGDAGAGKTHLFCDVAERRNRSGLPTILLHGSDFEGGDPLPSIKAMLELDTTMPEFLSALDAAGEASGSRALILVDALNEGGGPSVWSRYLAGLLDLAGRYPWVAVAVSVRTTYERLVIPEHIVPDRATSITHAGFGSMTNKAVRVFFDGNGIDRPGMPMLAPEFSNPLFLMILCKGLKNKGMTRMPEDKFSLMSVYDLYIESVNEKISGPDHLDRPAEARLVDRAVDAMAKLMVSRGSWRVDYMAAHEELGRIHDESRESRSLLSLLIREGVLSEDYAGTKTGPRRVVGFAYERMAENLVIRSVLHGSSAGDLPRLLAGGGDLAECLKSMHSYRGMIDALSIQVPEKFNRELIDVIPGGATAALYESFLASLAWRSPTSVGPRAAALVDMCLKRNDDPYAALGPLLSVSATPRHQLNAEYLDARLRPLAMAERDSTWSIFLDADYEDGSAVRRLIAWARDADKAAAQPETIELAGVALAWFLTCQNRAVRDGATKALVSLLSGHADILVRILARFAGCNDPYVTERLYCVAYGCAVHTRLLGDLEKLARHTYRAVFEGGDPPADIMLREYARLVLEEALRRGVSLDMDLDRCIPPYASAWIEEFPSQDQVDRLEKENTAKHPRRDGGAALFASLGPLGDFYIYVIGRDEYTHAWLRVPLLPGRLPRGVALDRIHRSITPKQKPHWERLLKLLYLTAERGLGAAAPAPADAKAPGGSDAEQAAKSQAEKVEKMLSPEQRAMLAGALSWFSPPKRGGKPRAQYFDSEDLARWIAVRVLEMGWTCDLFGAYDGAIERYTPRPRGEARERVGKKYQWIAYRELLARHCDNYEFHDESSRHGFGVYESSRQLDHGRDIDPSLLLSGPFPCTGPHADQNAPFIAYRHDWRTRLSDEEWISAREDLPDIAKIAGGTVSKDAARLVLGTRMRQDSRKPHGQDHHEAPYREFDLYMDSFLVRRSDAAALSKWWTQPGSWDDASHAAKLEPETFASEVYGPDGPPVPLAAPDSPWAKIAAGSRRRPAMVCPNVHTLNSPFSDYDYSVARPFATRIPGRLLVDCMHLRHNGRGSFVDKRGELVAHDPSVTECGPSALLFRKDAIADFLHAHDYEIVWRAIVHKRLLGGHAAPFRGRRGTLTMYATCRFAGGAIKSKVRIVTNGDRRRKR